MDWETNRIAVGTRFKISKLGAVRCPNLADKIGIVVGLKRGIPKREYRSVVGTFETCRRALRMSGVGDRPEVPFQGRQGRS